MAFIKKFVGNSPRENTQRLITVQVARRSLGDQISILTGKNYNKRSAHSKHPKRSVFYLHEQETV